MTVIRHNWPTRAEIERVRKWQEAQEAIKAADREARKIEADRAERERLNGLLLDRQVKTLDFDCNSWGETRTLRLTLDDGRTIEIEPGYDGELDVQAVKPDG